MLEAEGLSTTSISLVRPHTERIKPPRALFVPFPYGAPFGRPNDPELQHRVLRAALDLLTETSVPVLADFPDVDEYDLLPMAVQASAVQPVSAPADVAMETTQMRRYQELWQEQYGKTAVGLTGIPPTRFRGVVRFLEAFASGEETDMPERPADVSLYQWARLCVDDLKALYTEGRMAMAPSATGEQIARWFWGETALGALIVRVKERVEAAEDPAVRALSIGFAR